MKLSFNSVQNKENEMSRKLNEIELIHFTLFIHSDYFPPFKYDFI